MLKEETFIILLNINKQNLKVCPLYFKHRSNELHEYIKEKTVRFNSQDREHILLEKILFFEMTQTVVSERLWSFRNKNKRILKCNKVVRE